MHSKVQLRSSGDERTAQKLRSDLHERFDAGERAVAKAILSGSIRYSKLRGRLDKDGKASTVQDDVHGSLSGGSPVLPNW